MKNGIALCLSLGLCTNNFKTWERYGKYNCSPTASLTNQSWRTQNEAREQTGFLMFYSFAEVINSFVWDGVKDGGKYMEQNVQKSFYLRVSSVGCCACAAYAHCNIDGVCASNINLLLCLLLKQMMWVCLAMKTAIAGSHPTVNNYTTISPSVFQLHAGIALMS